MEERSLKVSDFPRVVVPNDSKNGRSSQSRNKHGQGMSDALLKGASITILMLGIVLVAYPFVSQYISGVRQSRLTQASSDAVAQWPYPQAEVALREAEKYNEALAVSGQLVMGETIDPFKKEQSSAQTESEEDTQYQNLLNQGDGIMGSVFIPKISVNIPIYHGTSEEALASGAGHLYGTSLPVGGTSTHAVITGHRGLVNSLMFTRLDEMNIDDSFYVDSMNRTIAYRIDRIKVIEPDDTTDLYIKDGEDRVTLMTCTPYGVNSHRLLISAKRSTMPVPVPHPEDAPKDMKVVVFTVAAFVGLSLLVTFFVLDNKKTFIARHAQDFEKI